MPIAKSGLHNGRHFLSRPSRLAVAWVLPGTFLGVLFLWPVARLLYLGVAGSSTGFALSSQTTEAVWLTVWQSALTTCLCLVLGLPGAYVLYLRKFRGQSLLRATITVPFMLPTIVVAISFASLRSVPVISTLLGGQSPQLAIIAAQVFMNYCIVVRTVGSVWVTLGPDAEDAAELDGASPLGTFFWVTLPALRTAIISSSLIVFLYCATSFGIVLVLGGGTVHSVETEIYVQALQNLDLHTTAVLTLMQTTLTIATFTLAYRCGYSSNELRSEYADLYRKKLQWHDWPVVVPTAMVVGLLIVPPLASVLSKAFIAGDSWSWTNFADLNSYGARDALNVTVAAAALNSLRNLMLTTLCAIAIGTRMSYLLNRADTSLRMRKWFDILFQLPVGISTVVLGLGYLVTFSNGFFPLRSSWLVVPLVQTTIATPLVIRMVYPALASIDVHLIETASTEGATDEQIWRYVQWPSVKSALHTAAGYVALISLGEFGAANFLADGNQGTLPTVLYQLISRPGPQNYGMALATCALLIMASAILVATPWSKSD